MRSLIVAFALSLATTPALAHETNTEAPVTDSDLLKSIGSMNGVAIACDAPFANSLALCAEHIIDDAEPSEATRLKLVETFASATEKALSRRRGRSASCRKILRVIPLQPFWNQCPYSP